MSETYRAVAGYEGLYEVSDAGNVKRVGAAAPLRPQKIGQYHGVNLCKEGIHKIHKIHRLVATAFIENPHQKPCVDHRDRDKLNNAVANLRWATRTENAWNAKHGGSTTGHKGVYLHSCGKFVARVSTAHKTAKHIGLFATKEEAAQAYQQAALQHHGEFACF